jgi:hypothetical protein
MLNMFKKNLIILSMILFSCEGIFHEENNEYLVIDNEQEIVDLLNGVYNRLAEVHNRSYFVALSRADDVNVYQNYSFSYVHEHGGGSCSSSGGSINFASITGEIYLNLYTAIANMNRLIPYLSETADAAILGELYFLRAYCYFKLARIFGTPPLVTDIDVDYFIEKPTYTEVYEFIEADMLKALELLSETYTDARIPEETPHKGMAKALLAEIYLAMAGFPVNDESKYAEAARLASEVIEQAEYYNYGLLDDMANLWRIEHRHNKENIFGLFFNKKGSETQNRISSASIGRWFVDDELMIIGGYNPEFWFFKTYPNNYRKYTSFVTGKYVEVRFDTINGYETALQFKPFDPLINACEYIDYAVSKKWIDTEAYDREESRWDGKNEVTLYLFRYAHTLLTYAEAKARSGEMDESCFEAVNMIRRRANQVDIHTSSEYDLPSDLTTDQFLDSLVWERAWELCTEPEGRWFDIVRLDLKDKLVESRYANDKPTKVNDNYLNEDWYFFLIPIEDRWLNPNFAEEGD